MLIENQMIKTKVGGKTIKHYKSLGYEMKILEEIIVPVNHLPTTSHVHIKIKCDRCNEVFDREYRIYLDLHNRRGGDYCLKCSNEVIKPQVIMEKYGVDNAAKSEEIKKKMKDTCLKRYGVEYSGQIEGVREKAINTTFERYGVKNMLTTPKSREKCIAACNKKWGSDYPFQSERFWKYFTENQYAKGSKQQATVYKTLYDNGFSPKNNVSVGRCILDIVIIVNNIKIDIEYDGWYWHQDKQKDRKRDEFLKLQGYKILRIRGGHTLPNDTELFCAINNLAYGDHSYKEIILSDWKETDSA